MNDDDLRALPDATKRRLRYVTTQLKYIGFQYGPEIRRATGDFTVQEVMHSLQWFHAPSLIEKPLTLITDNGEEIHFLVMGVRSFQSVPFSGYFDGDYDYHRKMFFPGGSSADPEHWFVIEGPIQVDDDGNEDYPYDYVPPALEGYSEGVERVRQDTTDEDMHQHLRVLAIVAFDTDGRLYGALVQRLQSPLDQVISIPPPT